MSFAPEDNNLAYTIAGVGRKRDPYDRRRSFAERLRAQGMDSSPVDHPLQGAARLAQALVGGYMGGQVDRDEKKATEDRNTKMTAAMSEADPTKRIGLISALDPELGIRLSGQMAIEQDKVARQREGLRTAAGNFGASYGVGGGGIQSGPLPTPEGYQGTLGGFESGNNPTAVNPQSGAGGQFQFMPQTWAEVRAKHPDLQLPETPMQASPQQQAAAEARFRDSNAQTLQGAGIPPSPANLYIAHRTGAQGAQTLLKTDPNAPMEAVVPQSWIAQNPDMRGKTVGQFIQMAQARFPGGQPTQQSVNVQATQPGQPQPLTINMGGPGGMPQGSAENVGMPPQPSPQGVSGPVMTAPAPPPAPAVPEVPRPRPSPQQIQQFRQRIASGEFGNDSSAPMRAQKALDDEIDRDWSVQRERAKMQFDQQSRQYTEDRKPTEAQKSVDSNFGKEYAEWVAGGGQADTRRQIVQLEEALGKLKSGKNLTGAFIGNLPDGVLNIFNPEAVATRNAVEEVVQRNLRLVLGAQFTEKEGERLISRAYNPSQSEEENAKRVGRLLEQIKAGAAAKVSAAQYYEQNGTLRGWSGKLPTLADFDPDARADRGSPSDLKKKYGLE
jgi:hypothetical protein